MLNNHSIKAVALVSSGLDSMLAAKIVRDLNIAVTGLHCVFHFDPFSETDAQSYIDRLFEPVNIPIKVLDITGPFLEVVLNPDHGYGSQVNPCIDCKIFMFRQARQLMHEIDAGFIVTGEVLGQRPMTQTRSMMIHIEKSAGLKGLVLRPLSAKRLQESLPEKRGWIDRNRLYGISGRGRKDQIRLAEEFGIKNFHQPAGGCILTNPQFSRRARAFFSHRDKQKIHVEDIQLLRLGRHFWHHDMHVIVGRNKEDNDLLERYRPHRTVIEPMQMNGPLTLVENARNQQDLELAASITARYCRHNHLQVQMQCTTDDSQIVLAVHAVSEDLCQKWQV